MNPTATKGATHLFEKPSNWDALADGAVCGDLQLRVETFGKGIVETFSTWKPSVEELALLNAGGVVEVSLCQAGVPAMSVQVVEPIAGALRPYVNNEGTEDRPHVTINEEAHGF